MKKNNSHLHNQPTSKAANSFAMLAVMGSMALIQGCTTAPTEPPPIYTYNGENTFTQNITPVVQSHTTGYWQMVEPIDGIHYVIRFQDTFMEQYQYRCYSDTSYSTIKENTISFKKNQKSLDLIQNGAKYSSLIVEKYKPQQSLTIIQQFTGINAPTRIPLRFNYTYSDTNSPLCFK